MGPKAGSKKSKTALIAPPLDNIPQADVSFSARLSKTNVIVKYGDNSLRISFRRTIRLLDGQEITNTHPALGAFGLHRVEDHATNMPTAMAEKGGMFLSMYQREAMWIHFDSNESFAIKIYADGINIVSGDSIYEDERTTMRKKNRVLEEKSIQDYLVVPEQCWIDGVVIGDGTIQQLVTQPMNQSHSAEYQLSGREGFAELQFEITPIKHLPKKCVGPQTLSMDILEQKAKRKEYQFFVRNLRSKVYTISACGDDLVDDICSFIEEIEGVPSEKQRVYFSGRQLELSRTLEESGVHKDRMTYLLYRWDGKRSQAVHEMPPLAEGSLKHMIALDTKDPFEWADVPPLTFHVQILNPATFKSITGLKARQCPAAAKKYDEAHRPFYESYEEPSSLSGAFNTTKSVAQVEKEKGIDGKKKSLNFPLLVSNEGSTKRFRPVSFLRNELSSDDELEDAMEDEEEEEDEDDEDEEDDEDDENYKEDEEDEDDGMEE